ncbi:MAG: hypothetical protein JNN28_11425 [Saprospiraceae bacterium]|nr:hypothetical protein [Saprospiraceae bacterium]
MKMYYFTATKWAFGAVALGLFTMTGCDKQDQTSEENITRVELQFQGNGFSQAVVALETNGDGIWDGTGEISLPANSGPVFCEVFVYDETQNPKADLTAEIIEESADHLFTYEVTGANVAITGLDTDSNGGPLGRNTNWETGAASTGTIRVKLHHEPTNKSNASDPGGDVDFDITFPIKIQ